MSAPQQFPRVSITDGDDGELNAVYPLWRFRFLFSDGRVIDVIAHREDSHLCDAVLAHLGGGDLRVAGVARLPMESDS